jgi:tetratricopeptide (TPR) repeat protein
VPTEDDREYAYEHHHGRRWWIVIVPVLLLAVAALLIFVGLPLLHSKEVRFLRHKEKAATFAAAGEFTKAIAEYQKALVLKPEEYDVQRAIAECRLKSGDLPEAIVEYLACPDDLDTQLTLASLYLLVKNMDATATALEAVSETEPDNMQALIMAAQAHYEQSDTVHPLVTVRMIADILPPTTYTYDLSRVVESLEGDREQRGKKLLEAVQAAPENIQVHKNLADFYLRQGDLDKAEAEYKKMVELAPKDPYVHLHLADFYRNERVRAAASGDSSPWRDWLDRGIKEYRQILEGINAKNLYALRGISALLLSKGGAQLDQAAKEMDEAKKYIDRLLWEQPADPYGRYYRGVLGVLERDSEKAEPDLYFVVDKGGLSERGSPHLLLGHAYLLNHKLPEAIKSLGLAAKVDLSFARPRLLSAEISLNLGKYEEAMEVIEKLLADADQQGNRLAHLLHARIYVAQNDYAHAEAPLLKLAELDPQSVHPPLLLGEVYKRTGKSDQAVEQYQRAIQLDPDSALPYYILGVLYEKRGEPEFAQLNLREAVRRDPNFKLATRSLAETYVQFAGENADARELGRTVAEQVPNDVALLDALAMVFYQRGRFDEAVTIFELIPPGERDARPLILYHYAEALFGSARKAAAERSDAETRRANRNYAEARRMLTRAKRRLEDLPQSEEIRQLLDEINRELGVNR